MEKRRRRVVVVGGGISGLTAAWRLGAGVDVVVLEGSPRTGGVLRSGEVGGVRMDLGAESVLARRPEAVALAEELGLGEELEAPATAASAVYSRGRVHPLPAGTLMGVPGDPARLRPLLTEDEIARVAREPGLPAEPLEHDVDVASWVGGRVGAAVVDRLVEPLLGGVYAGRADRLSLQAAVPQLWPVAQRGGSVLEAVTAVNQARGDGPVRPVFAGLRGGIARLPEVLRERLTARGAEVRTGVTVRGLNRTATGWEVLTGPTVAEERITADAVVLAVPAPAAAKLLAGVAPAAAAEVREIRTASVGLVAAVVPKESLAAVPGSGVLVPPVETPYTSGVKALTSSSAKWGWVGEQLPPDLAAIRLSLGRIDEEAVLQQDDDALARTALTGLQQITGRPAPARAWRVQRWGGALPQYDVGHLARVARVRGALAALPGLAVCGGWLDGVGVPACIAAATEAVTGLAPVLAAAPVLDAEDEGTRMGS